MKTLQFPKPKPDLKAYNKTLEKGFKRFPERYENYQKFLNSKKSDIIDYLPIKMDIENVSRCNLRCDMCQMATFKSRKRAKDLNFEDFKKIIDEQIGIFEIKIQGIGEPFLHKDFIKMVEYASQKDIWVRTGTNATVIHRNDDYKKIIDAGVGEIQFSIDGTSKKVYEKIRVNANFERVVQNCKLINDYCDSLGVDKTRMWPLLQNDNFHELHDFPAFAKELGFKRITLSMDINSWGTDELAKRNKQKKVSHKITQEGIDLLLEEAKELDIDLTFWDITEKYSKDNLCPWPFERSYISSDKYVVPCCMIGNPDMFNLGKLISFDQIWKSTSYQKFRKSHLTGKIPHVCRSCYK